MSEDLNEAASRQLTTLDSNQFAQLMTTVATALRQTTPPPPTSTALTTDQQAVALQYRLLRNGLGRFSSVSEAFDRALIRMEQVQYQGWSELLFLDPIPAAARSMVLVVESERVPGELPGYLENGRRVYRVEGESDMKVIELVEFLDQFDVPIAAGVPVQARPDSTYQRPESGISDRPYGAPPQTSAAMRRSQKSH